MQITSSRSLPWIQPASCALAALASAAPASALQATSVASQGTLVGTETLSGDAFGIAVGLHGDTAVVGADHVLPNAAGAAFVFVRNGATWDHEAKLTGVGPDSGDNFGSAVAIDTDTIVVGARYANAGAPDAGAAFVYVRSGSTWSHQATLVESDVSTSDGFGSAAAISGDTIVIGAPADDVGAFRFVGSAYVFVRNGTTWTEQAKLTANDWTVSGQLFEEFGGSVAIDGDTILVGASHADAIAPQSGAAYVFRRAGTIWTLEQKLTSSDARATQYFGFSVALSGDLALVGAPRNDVVALNSGAAYAFSRSGTTWTEDARLVASDAGQGQYFGAAVSLDGTMALIGAPHFPDNGAHGFAYVFERDAFAWLQQAKLDVADPTNAYKYGASVALHGGTALVGAPRGTTRSTGSSGTAYPFVLTALGGHPLFCFGDGSLATPCPCAAPDTVPSPSGAAGAGCANSFDSHGGTLRAGGGVAPDALRFIAELDASYQGFAQMIKGDAMDVSGGASGDGLKCANGALLRFGGHNAGTSGAPAGMWTYPNGVQTTPVSSATLQPAGASAYYQLVYRNAAASFCNGSTYNLTNGVRVDWP